MIISARIINFSGKTKQAPKDSEQDVLKVGRIVPETEDLDEWQLQFLGDLLDGSEHEIAIDEHVRTLQRGLESGRRE